MNNKLNYPRVLLVSDATWSDDNNIGNTFSNLFGNWDSDSLALIYARADLPKNNKCTRYFQIAENRMIRNIFDKNVKSGVIIKDRLYNSNSDERDDIEEDEKTGKNMYKFFKRFRWNIFLTARNILWKAGNWKSDELNDFIDEFNPDMVFVLGCREPYMNNLQKHILERANTKAAIYFVDDIYSAKQFSLSPFFWLNQLLSRKSIRKTVSMCDKIYTIIDKQKEEYDKFFERKTEIINKGGNFNGEIPDSSSATLPMKMIFTGNISSGRWKTLSEIGKALDYINIQKDKAYLYIYTQNQLEPKIERSFKDSRSIKFMGGIPSEQVKQVQDEGDILVHVESFKLKDKLTTRLSFSTKLVDYFERGRCILAIGWKEAASIDYLSRNQAAVVVDDLKELKETLDGLISNRERVIEFGEKGWSCGRDNHQIEDIRQKIYCDIIKLSRD